MSVAFKRLSYGFAEQGKADGQALPSDARALRQWLGNLPLGNPKQTAESLGGAMARSQALKLDGAVRIHQMEAVRAVALDVVAWLERQFLGSPLPLTNERLANARLSQGLHMALADGYRLGCYELCCPEGAIPMLKSGTVAMALQRSAWHYQQALVQSWKLYRSAPEGAWLGLHRVYRFALAKKLQDRDVDDPIAKGGRQVHDLYVETALLSLMNPLAFANSELDLMKSLAGAFARRCRIDGRRGEHAARLPLDADLPVDSDLPDAEIAWLEFTPLYEAIENASGARAGESAPVGIERGRSIEMPVTVLKRTMRALGLASARSAVRVYARYGIETATGLGAIHYFAGGRLDFENFIQKLSQSGHQGLSLSSDWLSMASDNHSQKPLRAEVIDHSLGGYHLHWPAEQSLRVRVGEIVGINASAAQPEPDWMVGVVRWLRYEDDGSVTAGVKLLSRRCSAIALRSNHDGRPGPLLRGLELPALDESAPRRFLMSGRLEGAATRIDALYGYEAFRAKPPRLQETVETSASSLASNMDYTLLEERA